uniref:Uncharacterized protein n=1 Tax=Haematococcus lacustris TaxID=44745 RepID=A0A2K9YRK0_HAELA|nr:hypothetical protein SG3EUKT975001.1 [Haematococcus lacustris]AUW36454.1 hypothetical protein SG3EUKT975001.1 [Haematococcus lacustris]
MAALLPAIEAEGRPFFCYVFPIRINYNLVGYS